MSLSALPPSVPLSLPDAIARVQARHPKKTAGHWTGYKNGEDWCVEYLYVGDAQPRVEVYVTPDGQLEDVDGHPLPA